MGENNFKKICFILFYFALAAVSCWATAESLKLLVATIPAWFWWILSIGLFIGASLGTKWMTDSLDQSSFVENRRVKLIGGLMVFLFCWLVCSMPTNTHTFFYRNYVDSKVNSDITTTIGYLNQLKTDFLENARIQHEQNKLENEVQTKMGELESEIMNDANPGFGPKSKEILASFANLLGVAKIEPLSFVSTNADARRTLVNAYRQKIYTLMDSKKENIKNALTRHDKAYKKEAAMDIENLELVRQYVAQGKLDLNRPKDIKEVCDKLDKGYSTIKAYKDLVYFSDQEKAEEKRYTGENPETQVRRLLNVFDVWKDFLNGQYPQSFWFWIVISIIVDLLAFIFFNIGFKNREF